MGQLKAYVERSKSDQGIVSLHYIVSNNLIGTGLCVLCQGSTLAVFRYPEHPRFSDGIPDLPAQESGRITSFYRDLVT